MSDFLKPHHDFALDIPENLRNRLNMSLNRNLFNRFMTSEESIPLFGYVGRTAKDPEFSIPRIPQLNLDRKLNALIPVIFGQVGAEQFVFSYRDLLTKAEVIGIDVDNFASWGKAQTLNFAPPIDLDKFLNFNRYFWIAPALPVPPSLPWSPDLDPEYYVIKQPGPTNPSKLPCRFAATANVLRTGSGLFNETWTVTITNVLGPNSTFDVVGNITGLAGSGVLANSVGASTLFVDSRFRFTIKQGTTLFSLGDSFDVDLAFIEGTFSIAFTGAGNGTISGVQSLVPFQTLPGEASPVVEGDRILLTGQTNAFENGIYAVQRGAWTRVADADATVEIPLGTTTYISEGVNIGTRWTVTFLPVGFILDDPFFGNFTFTLDASTQPNLSDWQTFNFWVHVDDLDDLVVPIDQSKIVQALRPILEYLDDVEMNDSVVNGIPVAPLPIPNARQVKQEFNQLPLFNVYRYDETHPGYVSPIFFYQEGAEFDVDQHIGRRIKIDENADYVFAQGLIEPNGRALFYKRTLTAELHSIWEPGPTLAVVTTPVYSGIGDGTISAITVVPTAPFENWQLVALSATTFMVQGSRTGTTPDATIGVLYTNGVISFTITGGATPFQAGDRFTFKVLNQEVPRYVYEDANGNVINFPGGPAADINNEGTWLVPQQYVKNLNHENREEIGVGDLNVSFESIIASQIDLTGASLGLNNYRFITPDLGLGGTIKEFNDSFNLFISLMSQRDTTPLSIIDFAEQQYAVAINSVQEFFLQEILDFTSNDVVIDITMIDPLDPDIQALLAAYDAARAARTDLQQVFSDTTAPISNWPVTLPLIGLLPAVQPAISFDLDLGIDTIVFHDGHTQPLSQRDIDFDRSLTSAVVTRSDGTESPGVFGTVFPGLPYKGLFFFNTATNVLYAFDVVSDASTTPPIAAAGEFWYNRGLNLLFESDGLAWLPHVPVTDAWKPFLTDYILNSLVLAVELALYDGVHPAQEVFWDVNTTTSPATMEIELAKFAAKYGLDTFAPDYSAPDPFTWNYSNATIPFVTPGTARWYDINRSYYTNFPGVSLETVRPNLEPWRLLGFPTKPVLWDATYAATVTSVNPALESTVPARLVATTNVGQAGFTAVDGVTPQAGDRILCVGQTFPEFNGLFIAGPGAWVRTADPLVTGMNVRVTQGFEWRTTHWAITTVGAIVPDVTPITFEQFRMWSDLMWADILVGNPPGFKVSVHVHTDELLPPYVSSTLFEGSQALTNTIPAGISNSYIFGQNGPVETIWKKSLEYAYGQLRSGFKLDPVNFLEKTWGYQFIQVNQMKLDRFNGYKVPHTKFLLHNEFVETTYPRDPAQALNLTAFSTAGDDFAIQLVCSYASNTMMVFSVLVDSVLVGYATEGTPFSFVSGDLTITNLLINDLGLSFIVNDTFVVAVTVAGNTATFTPAQQRLFFGTNQLFTNLLRYNAIDTDSTFDAVMFRGWDVQLGYRAGGLVRTDNIELESERFEIPDSAFTFVLKINPHTNDTWLQGIRVQLVQVGTSEMNSFGNLVPKQGTWGADWRFRIDTYNPRYPLVTYYELDNAPGTTFQTFFALNKAHSADSWIHFLEPTNLVTRTTGFVIDGVQNVVNFLFGYVARVEADGWRFNRDDYPEIDEETGRRLDWQLEIEKFVDRVYSGLQPGQGHVCNPFMKRVWLAPALGLPAEYLSSRFNDILTAELFYDAAGQVIPVEQLRILRTDEETTFYSDTPIFTAHMSVDQYEHVIVFDDYIVEETTSCLLFDPFLGINIPRLIIKGRQQAVRSLRPSFGGFYLQNAEVKKNIVAGIDSIANYYSATAAFEDQIPTKHALALLGFSEKDYWDLLNISQKSEFNFWRGLIQMKGTNLMLDAYLNNNKFDQAFLDEYWAYKIAEYGDARMYQFPELKLQANDSALKHTRIQFYVDGDLDYSPIVGFIQVEQDDEDRWFSIDDLGNHVFFEADFRGEMLIPALTPIGTQVPLSFLADLLTDVAGVEITETSTPVQRLSANRVKVVAALATPFVVRGYAQLKPKFNPAKLFNYANSSIVDEMSVWHPADGAHTVEAMQVVNVLGTVDPARYNYSTQTANNANYDALRAWGRREIGRVWWDLTNIGYVPYYDRSIFSNIDERLARWGSKADWATVDVYEWVQSDVAPSEYDALAASQEGVIEVDTTRASGKAARKTTYYRDRDWSVRPIAWSFVSVPAPGAHPTFSSSFFSRLYSGSSTLILDPGRFEDFGIVEGSSVGEWDDINDKPLSEALVTGEITYELGSSVDPQNPVMNDSVDILDTTVLPSAALDAFGSSIGEIVITSEIDTDQFIRATETNTGTTQRVIVTGFGSIPAGTVLTYDFTEIGIQVRGEVAVTGPLTAATIAATFANPLNDIYVRQAISISEVVPFTDTLAINDPADPDFNSYPRWRAWTIPTQEQLNTDLLPPNNSWQPFQGDFTLIGGVSAAFIAEVKEYNAAPLTLLDGTEIERYSFEWEEWAPLLDEKVDVVSDGGPTTITLSEDIDPTRFSLYINGLNQLTQSFTIDGPDVTLNITVPEGRTITALHRHFQPSAGQLAFDPDTSDDESVQTQYKEDYQYARYDVRDSDGNITGSTYFFWVRDKSTVADGKNMSIQQATSLLRFGPSTYMTFQHPLVESASGPVRYDAITLAGMNLFVTADDTYKVRFTRNFTLRDDPNELDLKNVHREWTLIRPAQRARIPTQLWDLLTNAVAGEDTVGQPLPSPRRVDYDTRHGTRTRYGFGPDQIFVDTDLARDTVKYTILNTKLTTIVLGETIPDFISSLDFSQSETWFATPAAARATMTLIWNTAKPTQINEIFFAVLDDATAANFEMTDIFKTSRISAYSIKVVSTIIPSFIEEF